MGRKETKPIGKYHIMIYKEDWEYLSSRFGPGGPQSDLGISRAIRLIIHQRVNGMKARENNHLDKIRDEQRPSGEEGVKLE